jgi:hypothetical protein
LAAGADSARIAAHPALGPIEFSYRVSADDLFCVSHKTVRSAEERALFVSGFFASVFN